MTGHFEKGKWIDEGLTLGPDATDIPLSITFAQEFSCIDQIERVAKLLNLERLSSEQMHGEMIIQGKGDHWYRILDFFEFLIKRMK